MRVLVTWGSKLGGTAGIAEMIAETLTARGLEVVAMPAGTAPAPAGFDAAIIGGAVYANRWHRDARHYVERHARALARIPVWLFSSGPLDDSASTRKLVPPRVVRALVDRIGAQAHVMFGGRLEPTVQGFPAAAMAKKLSGDWRDPPRIRAWATEIADALPEARPRPVVERPRVSSLPLVEYGVVGWALPATALVVLAPVLPWAAVVAVHAALMAVWFGYLAVRHQRSAAPRSPFRVALLWTTTAGSLDLLLVAPRIRDHVVMAGSVGVFWLPITLALAVTWAAGTIASMAPLPEESSAPAK